MTADKPATAPKPDALAAANDAAPFEKSEE